MRHTTKKPNNQPLPPPSGMERAIKLSEKSLERMQYKKLTREQVIAEVFSKLPRDLVEKLDIPEEVHFEHGMDGKGNTYTFIYSIEGTVPERLPLDDFVDYKPIGKSPEYFLHIYSSKFDIIVCLLDWRRKIAVHSRFFAGMDLWQDRAEHLKDNIELALRLASDSSSLEGFRLARVGGDGTSAFIETGGRMERVFLSGGILQALFGELSTEKIFEDFSRILAESYYFGENAPNYSELSVYEGSLVRTNTRYIGRFENTEDLDGANPLKESILDLFQNKRLELVAEVRERGKAAFIEKHAEICRERDKWIELMQEAEKCGLAPNGAAQKFQSRLETNPGEVFEKLLAQL
ncbi:MAG: hypothetical protein QXG98_00735 [Candidatus Micrarchaeia archaeon]